MKKFNSFFESVKPITLFAAAIMFIMSTVANAQMISQVDLEQYAKKQYGTSWAKAASKEAANVNLDRQGNIAFTKEIEAPFLTKDELYLEMANWFICNYDNSIQFADKEQGVLIARPYIQNIARSDGGFNAYDISICPTVRAQVLDGKIKVTYSLHDYSVVEEKGGGNTSAAFALGFAALAVTGAVLDATEPTHTTTYVDHHNYGRHTSTTIYREYRPRHAFEDALLLSCIADAATSAPAKGSTTWSLSNCFPFASKDKHKKASSKAFIMANVYSQVVMDNIEAAIDECSMAYASTK